MFAFSRHFTAAVALALFGVRASPVKRELEQITITVRTPNAKNSKIADQVFTSDKTVGLVVQSILKTLEKKRTFFSFKKKPAFQLKHGENVLNPQDNRKLSDLGVKGGELQLHLTTSAGLRGGDDACEAIVAFVVSFLGGVGLICIIITICGYCLLGIGHVIEQYLGCEVGFNDDRSCVHQIMIPASDFCFGGGDKSIWGKILSP